MYFKVIPWFIRNSFRDVTWRIKNSSYFYLTFDDGPDPDSTPQILELLNNIGIKATFFCSAKNIINHPQLFKLIIDNGHQIGNHGYNHISGWKSSSQEYLEDVNLAQVNIEKITKTNLFRPPYGQLTLKQKKLLRKKYEIIMWDIMPGDFDNKVKPEDAVQHINNNLKPGSIVVLHDKAECLERTLSIIKNIDSEKRIRFKKI